jgi:hypothetical protein
MGLFRTDQELENLANKVLLVEDVSSYWMALRKREDTGN